MGGLVVIPNKPDPSYIWEMLHADTGELFLRFDVSRRPPCWFVVFASVYSDWTDERGATEKLLQTYYQSYEGGMQCFYPFH